jgi:hypothetical protein
MSPMRGGRLLREAGDSQAIKIPANSIELYLQVSLSMLGGLNTINVFDVF